jgi:putative ABC transport system permease protein
MMRLLIRAVLCLYPRAFRTRWGADLERVMGEATLAAGWRGWRSSVWVLLDAVRALPGAWSEAGRRVAIHRGPFAGRSPGVGMGRGLERASSFIRALDALMGDVRYTVQLWRRAPGFTAFAAGTLALGMGAVIALFSVINGVLLRPMPYAGADRVAIAMRVSWPDLSVFERASSMEVFSYWQGWRVAFRESDGAVGVRLSASVAPDWFEMLGVKPALGRLFRSADDPTADGVVLSWGTWQSDFGGRPDVLGQGFTVDGRSYTVIGVAPRLFADPLGYPIQDIETAMYRLLPPPPIAERTQRTSWSYAAVVRLRPGRTPADAGTELSNLLKPEYEAIRAPVQLDIRGAREARVGTVGQTLLILSVAGGLLLLIGCANAANLMLSRATARRRELTVRSALGAARRRLVAQLLTESVMLALLAGLAGVWLGFAGSRAIVAFGGEAVPRGEGVGLDGRVIAFAFMTALSTAVLFGLAPMVQWSRPRAGEAFRESSRGTAGSRTGARLRNALVVSETALAVVLAAGAGLLTRSLWKLQHVDPGYDSASVLTLRVTMTADRYAPERRVQLHERIGQAIGRLSGVTAAAAVNLHPLSGGYFGIAVVPAGEPIPQEDPPTALFRTASPDYLTVMGIPLLAGRFLSAGDVAGSERVAVLNASAAHRLFGDDPAVGRSIDVMGQTHRIVGVAADVHEFSLSSGGDGVVYVPYGQARPAAVPTTSTFVVRSNGDASRLTGEVRAAIRDVDDALPIAFERTMRDMMDIDLLAPRLRTILIACFGSIAALLAAIGLTGVMAHSVTQSLPEIGVRMALGARERDVAGRVVGQALGLALAGVAIGLVAALAAGRVLAGLLFGVPPHDSVVLGAVALATLSLAALASWYPARRAARVSPARVLRSL